MDYPPLVSHLKSTTTTLVEYGSGSEEDNPLEVPSNPRSHQQTKPKTTTEANTKGKLTPLTSRSDTNNNTTPPPASATAFLLPDEVCYSKFDTCFRIFSAAGEYQQGTLQITNFRLRFTPLPCRCQSMQEIGPPNWHSNPACTVRGAIYPWGTPIDTWPPSCSFNELKPNEHRQFFQDLPLMAFRRVLFAGNELEIESRMDGQKFKLRIPSTTTPGQQNRAAAGDLIKMISMLAFPMESPVQNSFAFATRHRVGLGWNVFDFDLDAEKTMLDRSKRVHLRKVASPCATYPMHIYVPQTITDAEVAESATFRAKARLPVPVWAHPTNGALLVRSAQPQIGLAGSLGIWLPGSANGRNASDEKLIHELCGQKYLLVDARSYAAAKGNGLVRGMGTEQVGVAYEGCGEMMFGDMANIHELRSAFDSLVNSVGDLSNHMQWLRHVSQLLKVTYSLVHAIEVLGVSAWIHCSDGWDRTAQTCALAQLMMEPEYRTRTGFAICVEKNFAAYGFKFRERARGVSKPHHAHSSNHHHNHNSNANGNNNNNNSSSSSNNGYTLQSNEHEASPVFLLFIDAVYQLLCQFPSRFEFDSRFLLAVMDAYYSGRFGSFLCDCAREREEFDVKRKTRAVWDFVCTSQFAPQQHVYTPYYGVLHVSSKLSSLRFFAPYFLRFAGTGELPQCYF